MCAVYCNPLLVTNREEMYAEYSKEYRGGILGGNPDRSLKSFTPCYSQTPLVLPTFCFLDLRFLQTTAGKGGEVSGLINTWINEE